MEPSNIQINFQSVVKKYGKKKLDDFFLFFFFFVYFGMSSKKCVYIYFLSPPIDSITKNT